jgi:predicted nucleic acid-binding protein
MTDGLEGDAGRLRVGLADTSVFIAAEQRRPLAMAPPDRFSVSVVTIGELRLGVLAAADGSARAQRLETLSAVEQLNPLPIDAPVAHAWAALRVALRDTGKRMPINDSWIAATALAHEMPVVTQDSDYDDIPGLEVIRV